MSSPLTDYTCSLILLLFLGGRGWTLTEWETKLRRSRRRKERQESGRRVENERLRQDEKGDLREICWRREMCPKKAVMTWFVSCEKIHKHTPVKLLHVRVSLS